MTQDGQCLYYADSRILGYDIARIRLSDMTIQGALLTGADPRMVTASPDGSAVYAVHDDYHVDVWDGVTQVQQGDYRAGRLGRVHGLATDPSGSLLFASFETGLYVIEAEGLAVVSDEDADGVADGEDNCISITNPDGLHRWR